MSEKAKNLLALSIVPQVLLVKVLAGFPEVVEAYYSNGIYRFIASGYRYAFGWVPFSVGDIFYALAGIMILRFIWRKVRSVSRKPWPFFREILQTLSLAYLFFYLSWGLNYYRLPLHRSLGIGAEYTTEELVSFTEKLIERTNTLHTTLAASDSSAVNIPYSRREIYQRSIEGYARLAERSPHLAYSPASIKSSLFSLPLSYMGYGGYLNPFTNEAQVNSMQVDYRYPLVTCHEEAHQIGYSAENEANFIGYLAATANPDPYFRYSGYAYMLRYCLNETYRRDRDTYARLVATLHKGVLENYREAALFWKKYENPLEPIFKNTFNAYLEANNQAGGIKTYSYVVALLVNYHRKEAL
ncbi:DUF3810 domain-containing protein [Sinomicrobium soli]|uniref:DUF3810 domain-containing protein n=1 Tax=Sinomicrobium sp. N-1-3-6 TaxID=2219864 RepID=UPI000DCECE60|nr:DUF3810 domain-containing protein [Sinomicrobium sp. N-1-3-6]RAV27732.1 DUF3810 domain-containing protein [Sinomicrobium sp. N-1-3-6]